MRKFNRSLSALLAFIMMLSLCQGLLAFNAFADGETTTTEEPVTEEPTTDEGTTEEGSTEEGGTEEEEEVVDYTEGAYAFATAQDKLQFIKNGLAKYDENGVSIDSSLKNLSVSKTTSDGTTYSIYVDAHSGEFIWVNEKTGAMLLSNPYDVAYSTSATSIDNKYKMLSQVLLTYEDQSSSGQATEMFSYEEASLKGQVTLKYISGGIRVEYAMGEQESRRLVPRLIRADRFETYIKNVVTDQDAKDAMRDYYVYIDLNDPNLPEAQKIHYQKQYPISSEMAVYALDSAISPRELRKLEGYIKAETEYTFEMLNEDHAITKYEGNDAAPALFRFGLEYTLNDDGSLSVRMAASGLRYDEDNYRLKTFSILPFFGASNNNFEGYTFIPDGSGALIENNKVEHSLLGKVYGIDNAYHQIEGQNQQVMRLPVFGVTQYTTPITEIDEEKLYVAPEDTPETDEEGNPTVNIANPNVNTPLPYGNYGYLAIIEEGESLASIYSTHGGKTWSYSSVYTEFTPRASDRYDLKNTLSVSGNTTHVVESKRKYTGSYCLRYYMLTDDATAEKAGLSEDQYYSVDYNGMAKAYQNYLVANGTLTRLTEEDVDEDLPLYIESLGAIDTEGSILGIPVSEKTPLTTFDDLKAMYTELEGKGITNVNFRLIGFINGGMVSTYPCKIKFVKELGGDKGFSDFLTFANEKGIGVYPDFEFSYVTKTSTFDGFSLKEQAVRTIDDRYITQREYDPTWQMFRPTEQIVVSPGSMPELFEKFMEAYSKYDAIGISVGSLGSDLNSDFDRDDPYNRDDSQLYVSNMLAQLAEKNYEGGIMIDGGNSFALKYADHILNISFDSSRFAKASYSVPFLGMVLHGYVQYAGTPTNMASDSDYELLKMIENGANPYYMLSYENLTKLKEAGAQYSKYYSVDFKIWLDDMVENYNKVNSELGSLQTETIVSHLFLDGERAHTEEEEQQYIDNLYIPNIMTDPQEIEAYKKENRDQYFAYDGGTVVRVEYSDGTVFFINYNDYAVEAVDGDEIRVIEGYQYVKVTK